MSLFERYSFEDLVNEAERMVFEELERQFSELPDTDSCKTEDAVLDIAAYALNNVTPLYRVNLLGRIYANTLHEKHAREVRDAVAEGIARVRANPPIS